MCKLVYAFRQAGGQAAGETLAFAFGRQELILFEADVGCILSARVGWGRTAGEVGAPSKGEGFRIACIDAVGSSGAGGL